MSGDFVIVELDENSDTPIIDEYSLNRLNKEWEVVKVDFSSKKVDPSTWSNIKLIYKNLSQINKKDSDKFLNQCLSEINDLLKSNENKKSNGVILNFFVDFFASTGIKLYEIPNDKVNSILWSLNLCSNYLNKQILIRLLDPLDADECEDEKGLFPFLHFLVKSYFATNEVGILAQTAIQRIFKEQRNSKETLEEMLFDSFKNLFSFVSYSSPIISYNEYFSQLFAFLFSVFEEFHENKKVKFRKWLKKHLIGKLSNFSSIIQFKTFFILIACMKNNPFLPSIMEYIIAPNNIFANNIESWLYENTFESLNIIKVLLHTKSKAILTAYFYSEDIGKNADLRGFPEVPKEYVPALTRDQKLITKIDEKVKSLTRPKQDLYSQLQSNHIKTLFGVILDLYSRFFDIPIQIAKQILIIIETIAAIGNADGITFCFTPGIGIYYRTYILLEDSKQNEDLKKMNILAKFILTMRKILNALK